MNVNELPTNDVFGQHDWLAILEPSTDVDTTLYEVVSREAHGKAAPYRIVSVPHFWAESQEGYGQVSVVAVCELTDGWAAVTAGCDTTGWDCQAGAEWHWAPTRDQVISQGLTQVERRQVGIAIEEVQ